MGQCCDCLKTVDEVEEENIKVITKKVIVIGPTSVGKTTLIQQLIKGTTHVKNSPDISATEHQKIYDFEELNRKKTLVLKVWDTPGHDHFKSNRDVDYAHCDVVILVYSIDKDSTLDELQEFYDDAK